MSNHSSFLACSVVARARARVCVCVCLPYSKLTLGHLQEKVDRYLATPYLRKKAPLDVALVPKTTAGQERKKLWLIDRNNKSLVMSFVQC